MMGRGVQKSSSRKLPIEFGPSINLNGEFSNKFQMTSFKMQFLFYYKVSIYPWPGRDIGSIGRMFRNSPVLPTKQSGVILLISHHTLK